MSNVTFKQRVSLFIFGIFLTFILLELGLRLGGWAYTVHQEHLNRKALFQGQEFRILCLGESTTAIGGENSYPFQLQQALEEKRPNIRWVVINQGMVSKTSADILTQLDAALLKFQPQLVITMIGVNDPPLLPRSNSALSRLRGFLRHSRVYHLFELLSEHLVHRLDFVSPIVPESQTMKADNINKINQTLTQIEITLAQFKKYQNSSTPLSESMQQQIRKLQFDRVLMLVGKGEYYLVRGQAQEAQQVLLNAYHLAPENFFVLDELARCYRALGQCEKAIPLLEKANQLLPKADVGLVDLERCYADLGRESEAFAVAQKILKKNVEQFWIYSEIGERLTREGHLAEAEVFFKAALSHNAMDTSSYFSLAKIYAAQGKNELAQDFRQKGLAQQKTNEGYLPETAANYRQIASKILARGSQLIVMQYPLRHLEPLREIFPADWPVVYVENRNNFLKALELGQYTDYFSDNFAGDFGHCKRVGNRLIAQPLADVILQKILAR